MIKAQGVEGLTIGVLGLGRTGLSAARALLAGGAMVIAWDDNEAGREVAMRDGVETADLSQDKIAQSLDRLITSPGIAHLYPKPHPAIDAAYRALVPVDNDIGLFFQAFATQEWSEFETMPKVVSVTGSNGKSTTAALIHHILCASGRKTQLAGNIGRAVLDIDPPQDGEVIVLELSSYQTELARALTPDIAVLTNISPDHLARHGGEGGYFAAKRRLFAEGGPDRAVIGVDETEGVFLANQLAQGGGDDRVIRIAASQKLAGAGWSVFVRKGFLAEWRKGRQVAAIDLRGLKTLAGAHNHQNICAAYAVCRSLGLAPRQIETALPAFAGLAHRSQWVLERGGVQVINDSKATNVASAQMALAAHKNIRWIVGGEMKEGGLSPLKDHPNVRKAYVIGTAAAQIAEELEMDKAICTTMDAAVRVAWRDAKEGETILLAPAGASFDQYANFEERGEDFIRRVTALAGEV